MQILGILIDKPFIRVALIEKSRGKCKIIYLNSHPYSEFQNVKQLYTKSFRGKVLSSLGAKCTLMSPIKVNIGNSRHLEQAISFQVEAASHLNKQDILSDAYILEKTKEKTSALLFTTTKEILSDHLKTLEKFYLDPDSVSSSPLALVEYFKWKLPKLKDAFFVDLGSEEWTCVCMDQGILKKFHSIDGGITALLDALLVDRKKTLFPKEVPGIAKQIDLLQLKSSLNPHLSQKLKEMKQELARVIYAYFSKHGKKPLFFSGRTDAFSQIEEFLKEGLEDSIESEDIEIPKEEKKYAIPIGLGVARSQLQFRKEEFFPNKTWKSLGAFALFLGIFSLALGISLVGITNFARKSKAQEMVSSLESSLMRFDPELHSKIFSNLSGEDGLKKWDRAVSSYLKQPAYMAPYPKVSEILSWLYSHPLMQEKVDPIRITSFHYQLISFPRIDAPKEPYEAKIELEFETKSPLNARKLHEEIHEGNEWVSNKEEVQWDVTENLYRTSFNLKNECLNDS